MPYKITERNLKTGKEIVSSNDQGLTAEQAKANLDRHERLWLKFGGEIRSKEEMKVTGYDPDQDAEITWTIEEDI